MGRQPDQDNRQPQHEDAEPKARWEMRARSWVQARPAWSNSWLGISGIVRLGRGHASVACGVARQYRQRQQPSARSMEPHAPAI